MKQVEARLPSQTVLNVMVVFLYIRYAEFSKTTIDTEIYDKAFDYFVTQVLGVHKNIAQK